MIEEALMCVLISSYLLAMYLKNRELRKLSEAPSKTYLKLATPEHIEKTRLYNKEKIIMSMIEMSLSLLKDLYIVNKRLLQHSYNTYMRKIPYGEVLFVVAYFHLERIFEIPFSIAATFYIEAKYGFNKTTPVTFIMDFVKNTLILTAIIGPFVCVMLNIIKRYCAVSFYIYLWLFSSVFQVVLVIIYPLFIQPLFNKFEEMKESDLKIKIQELAGKVGFTASKIFVMDASRRSGHSNAYFIGLTKEKRIVLFDTLFKQMNEAEILAILCHEFGHWKYSHSMKLISLALAIQLGYFYLFNSMLNSSSLENMMFYENEPLVIKILYFLMVLGVFSILVDVLRNSVSRRYEKQADRFAVEMGYGSELSSGLVKLCEENSSNMDPDPLYAAVMHTHPTAIERIRLIEEEINKVK